MNNSEPPSSPEEKWTAYLDGKLSSQEAAAFECEHPGAAVERAIHERISRAMREHASAPALRNADFFNASILEKISPRNAPAPAPASPRGLWSLWRLAIAGACCLIAAAAIYVTFVRPAGTSGERERYLAQVVPAKAGDEGITRYLAQVVSAKAGDENLAATVLDADGLAVVWIDGLDQLPNDYELK